MAGQNLRTASVTLATFIAAMAVYSTCSDWKTYLSLSFFLEISTTFGYWFLIWGKSLSSVFCYKVYVIRWGIGITFFQHKDAIKIKHVYYDIRCCLSSLNFSYFYVYWLQFCLIDLLQLWQLNYFWWWEAWRLWNNMT